jgi:hypothetical protein
MTAITVIVVGAIIYGIILEKREDKEFKDRSRFNQWWDFIIKKRKK